jgi:hypothetical protein
MAMVFRSSLGPARTSPLRQPCSEGFLSLRLSRNARPSGRSTSCSTVRQSSRRRARCHDDVGLMPTSVCLPDGMIETRLSTRRRVARGLLTSPRYKSMSAPSVTLVSSWTPVGVEGMAGGRQPTMDTTPVVAGATTPMRTRARAPHHRGLRLSPDMSSARRSHSGTTC